MFNLFSKVLSFVKNDILFGLMVVLVLVFEVVVFVFVVNVEFLVGLYVVFIVGLIIVIFGGCLGMIFGVIGVLVVVMVSLVLDYGVEYLFVIVFLMGIL